MSPMTGWARAHPHKAAAAKTGLAAVLHAADAD